jgi:hypothetical protein
VSAAARLATFAGARPTGRPLFARAQDDAALLRICQPGGREGLAACAKGTRMRCTARQLAGLPRASNRSDAVLVITIGYGSASSTITNATDVRCHDIIQVPRQRDHATRWKVGG